MHTSLVTLQLQRLSSVLFQLRRLPEVCSFIWVVSRIYMSRATLQSRVTHMNENMLHSNCSYHLRSARLNQYAHKSCHTPTATTTWALSYFNLDYYLRSAHSYESCHVYTWVLLHSTCNYLPRPHANEGNPICDMIDPYVWHDSSICVTWLINTCDMSCVTLRLQLPPKTPCEWRKTYVWHDSFICVTWPINICDMRIVTTIQVQLWGGYD